MIDFCVPCKDGALRQGEILSNVRYYEVRTEEPDEGQTPIVNSIEFPYCLVVSQDCDLDWDFKATNILSTQTLDNNDAEKQRSRRLAGILLCEASSAKDVKGRSEVNSTIWSRIKINKDERFHFLEEVSSTIDTKGCGLPELTLDFKHYFTVSSDMLYKQIAVGLCTRRVRLKSPYLEHLAHRFSSYMSRVALPEDYKSMPEK